MRPKVFTFMWRCCVKRHARASELHSDNDPIWVRGGGYSLLWPIRGRATGQGMVFGLSVLNRVYNFMPASPKQGMVSTIVIAKYEGLHNS